MNIFALIAAAVAHAVLTPATKVVSWSLRQTEGTEKGTAAAQKLQPDVNRIAESAGDAAASEAAAIASQAKL